MAINIERGADTALDRALEELGTSDRPVVVLAASPEGAVGSLLDRLPADSGPVVRAAAARATRAKVGCLAEELGLDELTSGVVVVEDAQWADPTSLGRLQRLVKSSAHDNLVLIIAYRAGEDLYGIEQLAETAERHGHLVRTTVEPAEVSLPPEVTNPSARDLVLATSLVLQSIPVGVAAQLLDVSESEVLDIAEPLVAAGLLHETRSGFLATAAASLVEAGEARTGHMASRLATVLEETGADPAVVGNLRLAAGEPGRAYPLLLQAARAASARSATGEAFHLAEAALEAAADVGTVATDAEKGELHLICGRHLRAAGRSAEAAVHLERATSLLVGEARIDALGFAAAVADDRQHPQESERILAMAEWEAATEGEIAKLGSLGTFHARSLNRLGFAAEADAMLAKAEGLLEHEATPAQRANAELNRAWILFDRGQVARAGMEFTHLRDTTDPDDYASLADKEAWRARALFASGQPDEAMTAVAAARDLAERGGVEAPLFLTDLALTEGNLLYGRPSEALSAGERVLDLVERQLTAWENVARAERSLAFLRLGESEQARTEVAAALAATPSGADGWRWRSRCRAIEMEIAAHAGSWNQREAEDLADMFLQAEYYGWAADLMCVIAEHSKDAEVAREAMALALQVGNPMLAVRAAAAGALWKDPGAAPVIRAVRAMADRLPEGWEPAWRAIRGIEDALAAPEPAEDDAGAENAAVLEQALRRAGLAGADVILSPAQRRNRGLVRRRRRRWTPIQVVAAAVGVVAVAAITSIGVAQLVESPPNVTVITQVVPDSPATTVPLALEETAIPLPDDLEFFFGEQPLRGGPSRTGVAEAAGPRRVDGYFWTYETTAAIVATPVAYGRNLIVGSTDGTVYALDLTTGRLAWTLPTDGRITAAPVVATAEAGEGQRPALALVPGEDGVLRARDAIVENESERWSVQLGERITSSPVTAEELVMVGTVDGFVHALSVLSGEEVWTYPAEGEGIGPISAPLAYSEGVVYVGAENGTLHLLDLATGNPVCGPIDYATDIVASPIISDGAVYVPTRGNTIFVTPAGQCSGSVPDRLPLYNTDAPVELSPAIRGDRMYLTSGPFLYSIDLTDNSDAWPPSTVDADSVISTAPVVANDTVYFGTQAGTIHAVDADSGEALWTWRTGNVVRASPVVIDGAVYVASGDGKVYALGEAP